MKALKITTKQLQPPPHTLKHVGSGTLNVLGSCYLMIEHNHNSLEVEVDFTTDVLNMYLPLDVCKNLHIVHEEFPNINVNPLQNVNSIVNKTDNVLELPFEMNEMNISKIDKYFLEAFFSTTITTSVYPLPIMAQHVHFMEHSSLQLSPPQSTHYLSWLNMSTLWSILLYNYHHLSIPITYHGSTYPLYGAFFSTTITTSVYPLPIMAQHIHFMENAIPVAAHTPIPIPHYWKNAVKDSLDNDEKMGIIRKAPVGRWLNSICGW